MPYYYKVLQGSMSGMPYYYNIIQTFYTLCTWKRKRTKSHRLHLVMPQLSGCEWHGTYAFLHVYQ